MLLAFLGLGGLGLGCAAKTDWSPTRARACDPSGPARVCLRARPDQPLILRAGESSIVPGECMKAPHEGRGGRLPIELEDGRSTTSNRRWISARRGHTTEVVVNDAGEVALAIRECRRRVEDWPFLAEP